MEENETIVEGRGRSAKKRQAQEISKLAARAVELSDAAVTSLALDAEPHAALIQLRQTRSRGAKKRALKYFAGHLRRDEEAREKLQAAVSHIDGNQGREAADHQELERLREQLCSADEQDAALQVVATDFPTVDRRALLRLIKSVRHSRDKRAFREIFRKLREARES